MEDTNATPPRPRSAMPGTSSLVSSMGAARLTVASSVTFAAGISPTGPAQPRPALLTSTSMPPRAAASACSARPAAPPGAARSPPSTVPPVRPATSASRASSRPLSRRLAPAPASATAVAAPIPEDAPVTSATAPSSRMAPHFRAPARPWQGPVTARRYRDAAERGAGTRRAGRRAVRASGAGRGPPVLRRPGLARPAADDVAHGQQPGHLGAVEDDQVPEPGLDHDRRRPLQGPVRGGEHDVRGAVRRGQLGVGVLARSDGIEDVALGKDAHPGMLGVGDHGGADPPGRHLAGGFSQGMRGADRQDQLGHPVAYQHLASLPELAVVGDAWPVPAPPGAKRLCLCDFTYSMGDARPQGNPRRGFTAAARARYLGVWRGLGQCAVEQAERLRVQQAVARDR